MPSIYYTSFDVTRKLSYRDKIAKGRAKWVAYFNARNFIRNETGISSVAIKNDQGSIFGIVY